MDLAILGVVLGVAGIALAILFRFYPPLVNRWREETGRVLGVRDGQILSPPVPTVPEGPAMLHFSLENLVSRTVPVTVLVSDADGSRKLEDEFDVRRFRIDLTPYSARTDDPRRFELAPHDKAELGFTLFPRAGPTTTGEGEVRLSIVFFAEGHRVHQYIRGPFSLFVQRPPLPPKRQADQSK